MVERNDSSARPMFSIDAGLLGSEWWQALYFLPLDSSLGASFAISRCGKAEVAASIGYPPKRGFFRLYLNLQHLLDDLLLLDQERAHNAGPHAVGAQNATVSALHVLGALGQAVVRTGPQTRDAGQPKPAARLAALGASGTLIGVMNGKLATGGLQDASLVRLGGVRVPTAVSQTLNHGCC
eukprot:72491-Prorocentrum_minimum.AAC.6